MSTSEFRPNDQVIWFQAVGGSTKPIKRDGVVKKACECRAGYRCVHKVVIEIVTPAGPSRRYVLPENLEFKSKEEIAG